MQCISCSGLFITSGKTFVLRWCLCSYRRINEVCLSANASMCRQLKKQKNNTKAIKSKKAAKGLGHEKRTIQTWAFKLIRAVQVLQGWVAGGRGVLALQHLSRLGPQGAIVRKGAGCPPLVTGRGIKPVIGEAWEIQYKGGGGGRRG